MLTLFVISAVVLICIGMAIAVYAFGTGGKRANTFKDIYFSIEMLTALVLSIPRPVSSVPL